MQQTEDQSTNSSLDRERRSRRLRGLLLALGGAAAVALNFVTSKYARREINLPTFITLWFASAWFYTSVYIALKRVPWRRQLRGRWKPLVLIGILHGTMAFAAFEGIHLLDPTVASFFSRSSVVFGVLLGLIVLSERPSRQGWIGVGVAVAGIILLSYATGASEPLGVILMLATAILLSFGLLVGKYVADTGSPAVTVSVRSAVISIMGLTIGLATGHLNFDVPLPHLLVTIGGAAVGPFGAQLLFFGSLRYISLSELSVVRAASPVFVAIYSYVFLWMFPTMRQLVGGTIVMAGIITLARSRPVEEEDAEPTQSTTQK